MAGIRWELDKFRISSPTKERLNRGICHDISIIDQQITQCSCPPMSRSLRASHVDVGFPRISMNFFVKTCKNQNWLWGGAAWRHALLSERCDMAWDAARVALRPPGTTQRGGLTDSDRGMCSWEAEAVGRDGRGSQRPTQHKSYVPFPSKSDLPKEWKLLQHCMHCMNGCSLLLRELDKRLAWLEQDAKNRDLEGWTCSKFAGCSLHVSPPLRRWQKRLCVHFRSVSIGAATSYSNPAAAFNRFVAAWLEEGAHIQGNPDFLLLLKCTSMSKNMYDSLFHVTKKDFSRKGHEIPRFTGSDLLRCLACPSVVTSS